jgi:hypothetical protein
MLRPYLTVSVLCLFAAAPAANAELSYSYLDGALAKTSIDTATLGEQDGVAGEFEASYEILSFLYVLGGYEYAEWDDLPIDGDLVHAGAGVHYESSDHASIFFNVEGLKTEADVVTPLGVIRSDEDGYGYAFGYREVNKNGRMEFAISAEHQEFDDAADTWVNMSLLFRVTPRFKILAGVTFAGEENAGRVGVRYYLPNRFDNK